MISARYVLPKEQIKKLDNRSRQGIFVGYAPNSKAVRIWDRNQKRMIISRDVIFDENDDETKTHPACL